MTNPETKAASPEVKLARLRTAHANLIAEHRRQGERLERVENLLRDLTAGLEAEGVFSIADIYADVGNWGPEQAGRLIGYLQTRDQMLKALKGES